MKTRYSSLVTVKKSEMQKSEGVLQNANTDLTSARQALELSYNSLNDVNIPLSGQMISMLASKTLLESQRSLIAHNKEWVDFAHKQVSIAKEKLKLDMIEYEKFKYLDISEMEKVLKEREMKEVKDLDEVALITHTRKKGLK